MLKDSRMKLPALGCWWVSLWRASDASLVNSANIMKRKLNGFSRRYHAALRRHLAQQGRKTGPPPPSGLGRQAMMIGLESLDLARIHEEALVTLVLPSYSPDSRAG